MLIQKCSKIQRKWLVATAAPFQNYGITHPSKNCFHHVISQQTLVASNLTTVIRDDFWMWNSEYLKNPWSMSELTALVPFHLAKLQSN